MNKIRSNSIVQVFIVLSTVSILACCDSSTGSSENPQEEQFVELQYNLIEQGCYSGYTLSGGVEVADVTLFVIKSEDELDKFWLLHKANEISICPAPIIDFDKKMVIAIMCPAYSSGGYHVEVDHIFKKETENTVAVIITSPGDKCLVTTSFTQPYIIIETALSELPVSLKLTRKTADC